MGERCEPPNKEEVLDASKQQSARRCPGSGHGAGIASTADASTFGRVGLDHLVAENGTIVLGEVLATSSYWNAPGTFIYTDVRVAVAETLKGEAVPHEIVVTLPGGTVGELTATVIGAAQLAPGRQYVLFLEPGNLQGKRGALTIRDHGQGVFDVLAGADGPRAVSQARRHVLVADAFDNAQAVGGAEGLRLDELIDAVRDLAGQARSGRPEVK